MQPYQEYIAHHTNFSFQDISWGYRDIFASKIAELFKKNLLGKNNKRLTKQFFSLLEQVKDGYSGDVLHEFLQALNPRTYWLFSFPELFVELTNYGCELGREKVYFGNTFFFLLGQGTFGRNPALISQFVSIMHYLREVDTSLALAFAKGYAIISERLDPDEMRTYVNQGIAIFKNNKDTAVQFLQTRLSASIRVPL